MNQIPYGRCEVTFGPIQSSARNVKDYGAVGDAVRDDTEPIQTAMDVAAIFGNAVYFPRGTYRTTAPLSVEGSGVRLFSNAGLHVEDYNDIANLGPQNPAVICSDHDGDCLQFKSSVPWQSISLDRISMWRNMPHGVGRDARTGTGISILSDGPRFCSRLYLNHVEIGRFCHGIRCDHMPPGSVVAAGHVVIENSEICHCNVGILTMDTTRLNGFHLRRSFVRHNSMFGVVVAANDAMVVGNVMEGQPYPLYLGHPLKGATIENVTVSDNHFEKNTGEYCLRLYRVNYFHVGLNRIGGHVDANPPVQIHNSTRGTVEGPAEILKCNSSTIHHIGADW